MRHQCGHATGFSLVELITVLVVAGILAAVAVPQLSGTKQTYDDLGFYDGTKAILRFAQKTAIAKRRLVCVAFTATNVTLTYSNAFAPAACGPAVIGPDGATPYTIATTAGGASSFNPVPAAFAFDPLGRPVDPATSAVLPVQTISIIGIGAAINVESESGYVH